MVFFLGLFVVVNRRVASPPVDPADDGMVADATLSGDLDRVDGVFSVVE